MTWRPPGTLRVLQVLALTALRRVLRAAAVARSKRAARSSGRRQATVRKRGNGLVVLMVAMLPLFGMQALTMASGAVQQFAARVDGVSDAPQAKYGSVDVVLAPRVRWPHEEARAAFVGGSSLLLVALALALLVSSLGAANLDLGRAQWQLSWLLTFPVPTRSLALAKALEYGLVQFFPWLTLFPLLLQMLRTLGISWSLPLALLATVLTATLNGALRLWLETWLRMRLPLHRVRSVQGVCTLLGLALLGGVFSVCLGSSVPDWFVAAARAVPAWLAWLPASWPLLQGSHGVLAGATAVLVTLLALAAATAATVRLLAHGAMRSSGVDPGRRGEAHRWASTDRLHGVLGKDLRLLLRDRNFLAQTVGVPVFVVVMNLVVNRGFASAGGRSDALIAYGIGSYAVLFGCFQVLSGEGRALWVLYTLPVRVAEVLRRKVRLWACFALVFAWTGLVSFAAIGGAQLHWSAFAVNVVFVGAGVWAAAHLAAAIGILGTDPAADHVPRQPKARHIYLYLFFAGTYLIGLNSADPAVRVASLLIFGSVAFAFWQRACDRLPWLLDPVDQASPTLSLADGAAAVLVFQLVLTFVFLLRSPVQIAVEFGSKPMLIAFATAGCVTTLLFGFILSLRGIDLRTAFGLRPTGHAGRSLLVGCGLGLLTGAVAVGYVHLVRACGWFELPQGSERDLVTWLLLACVAAPLFEELIFRGLLFQGLERSVPLRLALPWSAALFMVVHRPQGWVPVFGLGLGAAFAFRRTRFLPAAMATHAVYNGVVLLWAQ